MLENVSFKITKDKNIIMNISGKILSNTISGNLIGTPLSGKLCGNSITGKFIDSPKLLSIQILEVIVKWN